MPIDPNDNDDISNAINVARQDIGGGNAIQSKVGGLNQFLSGFDLEANTPQFHTGINQSTIGGAGMPSGFIPHGDSQRNNNLAAFQENNHPEVPHVAYHGTNADISTFNPEKIATKTDNGYLGHGFYFDESPIVASAYGRKGNVMPVHLAMENPLHLKYQIQNGREVDREKLIRSHLNLPSDATPMDITNEVKSRGHDGIIYNGALGNKEIVAFNPTQIKSATGNNGQFDPTSPRINEARGGDVRAHHAGGGRAGYATMGGVPLSEDDQIAQAVSTARQPSNLVTEWDAAGFVPPRQAPNYNQTLNAYSPKTEAAPLNFGQRLSNVLYNRFVQPAVSGTNNPPIAAPGIDITPQMRESIMRGQKAFKRGGRTLGNNAIDNALRLATGGDADSSQPDAPITLQDLKDWKKAHPLSLNKNAMDNVFSIRQSGFEGAEPIAMPANLDELMAYLRRQHHATGGRAHFGYGGDTDSDSHPESGQTGTASAERSVEAQAQGDKRTNERGFADQSQPDAVSADVGSRAFGGDFNVGGDNYTGHEMPTGMANYSEQRMNTPYEGSLLSATMDPSTAFGMGYGSLVGRQNTRAGAAGFLGSAMGESGAELDPSAINAGSIGMLQETGPRRIGLENTLGIDTSLKGNALRDALAGTQMAQLGYGLNEVATKPEYGLTRNAMATGTNAANVADIALENFERPTLENQIKSAPSREAYAQGIMAGRPSGATLGVGQYDAAPASFRDALMGGVKQADQQKSRLNGDNTGAMLANASVSDASNDPAITAARNAAIASGEMPQSNPYAGFSSEDPAEIARYNAAMNAAGPKNAYADTTLGQRVPDVTSNNPFVNVAQGASNFLTNMITPSYGINSPEYNKISQAVDIAREPREGRGGEQPYIPPTATTQAPAAPIAPYTTELGTYNQQLPSVGGMTAAQWAAANTAGDMSKVHGRIKYVNGAPMLEYYTQ